MIRLTPWLARHPLGCVLATLLLSALAFAAAWDFQQQRPRVNLDASIDRLLPAADADRAVFDRVQAIFGDQDVVLVAVDFGTVFTAENLDAIDRLSRQLRTLPGVAHVFSLATAPNLSAQGANLEVSTFTDQARREPGRIADFPAELAANPVYDNALVSGDGRMAAFALTLSEVDETAFRQAHYPQLIRSAVRETVGAVPVYITGSAVVKAATTDALFDAMRLVIPLIFVLMIGVLTLAFRSLRATLVAAVAVGLALLWVSGTVAVLGLPLNLVTVLMPPLVMTLGFAYAVHALSEFLQGAQQETRSERLERTWNRLRIPQLLTAVTTVIGLGALAWNPLPAIREFAVLSAAGVVYAALLAFFFVPSALALTGTVRAAALPGEAGFTRWAARIAAFDVRHRRTIIAVAVLLVPLGMAAATQLRVATDYLRSFPPEAEVRRDFETINSAFDGANLISILIETHVNDALTDPDLARQIEELQVWLRAQPEIGAAVSYVDYLKLLNQNINEGQREYFTVPGSSAQIKQLLVFGGSEELNRLLDARMRSALISVRIKVDGSEAIADLVARIRGRLASLPPPLNGAVTGSPVLATSTVDSIASGQWQSVGLALFVIWAMLALMFTSARAGLIAMLPNIVPVAVYFGLLSLLDIGLSPTNSLIACIVLGVAVDDTIHYMARFNADARSKANEPAAVHSALAGVLRPVTLNTLALCLGFIGFTVSGLRSQVEFGLLAAFTLGVGWVADLLLTPALGSLLRIVTLWDLLRLDLGRNPQHTIPLFSGLSLREARVFALIAKLEQHPAGARIIQEGDVSRDMYVVVDGNLQVFVEREGSHKPLANMTRGTVIGETGYFGQRRTASVETATKTRLLRFDSQDLERLRERYPRIAATVFRNLNRIQAERLARTTAMVH